MQSLCVGISSLLLSALFPLPGAGQFNVIGPAKPVIALVGEEAVLPCHLSPVTDASGMEVTWNRTDPPGMVHHYDAGKDKMDLQHPAYQGRTEFLKQNITTGQVALRIRPILLSDDGQYSCVFGSSTFENEAQFSVLVTVSGIEPHIHIETGGTEEMKLTCTSSGWYPEPEVQWRNIHGVVFRPVSETKTREGNGLFHIKSSATVNTTLLSVSCAVRNPVLREEKEVSIFLSDALFPKKWPWILGVIVIMLLILGCVGAASEQMFRKC